MTNARARRTALWGIVGAVFMSGTAIGSILPILPLFLRERGASYALTGVVVSASLVAQALGQWPAGWLSDRAGRRPLMVGGLLLAALASVALVLPVSVPWLIVLRFIQGLGIAAATPAERAAVADLVPPAELGVAYGWLSGARMAGLIAGPALGGLLAISGRWTVFVATGVALAIAAAIGGLALGAAGIAPVASSSARPSIRQMEDRPASALRGVLLLTVGVSLMVGSYDVVWSLFMRAIGATDWIIGLSFSLWALPFVLVTPLAGWACDRWDRRLLMVIAIIVTGLMAPIYPALHNIPLILIVGVVEAALFAFAEPAKNAFVMNAVPLNLRGEAQGTVGMVEGGAMAVGAFFGGTLFAMGLAVPFIAGAIATVIFGLLAIPALLSAGGGRTVEAGLLKAGQG